MALLKKETLRLKFSFLLKKRDQAIAVLRRDDSPQHTCQGRKSKWLVQSQSRRAIAHYIELKFKQQKHECGAAAMESFHEYILEYRKQMEKGAIRKAYKGLMEYILNLKTYLKNKYPDYFVSGSIYFGYMDMTYFSFYPKSLGDMKLKIAIVFIHESMRFEVWLAGYNKQVQSEYWKMIKENNWNKYQLVSTIQGADSILEHIVVDNPDFRDLDELTKQIEKETMIFIRDVDSFLSKQK